MASYNRIIIAGNLTRDPELRQAGAGQVCRLGLASNRQYKNRQTGAVVQEVCFVDVDVWGLQAESCNQYLRKGRPVLVEGRLKLDSWKEADGSARSKHSIVAERVIFLGTAQGAEGVETLGAEDASEERRVLPAAAVKPAAPQGDDTVAGTPLFKDTPPFQDDLPF